MHPSKKEKIGKDKWTVKPCDFGSDHEINAKALGEERWRKEEALRKQALKQVDYSISLVDSDNIKQEPQSSSKQGTGPLIETLSEYNRRRALEKNQINFLDEYMGTFQVEQVQSSPLSCRVQQEVEFPPDDFYHTKLSKQHRKVLQAEEKRLKAKCDVETARKKVEELKKLKNIINITGNKFRCHKYEREQDDLLKKKKFLTELAKKLKCSPEDLKKNEDELYAIHKKQQVELRKLKNKEIDKEIEWMERFIASFPPEDSKIPVETSHRKMQAKAKKVKIKPSSIYTPTKEAPVVHFEAPPEVKKEEVKVVEESSQRNSSDRAPSSHRKSKRMSTTRHGSKISRKRLSKKLTIKEGIMRKLSRRRSKRRGSRRARYRNKLRARESLTESMGSRTSSMMSLYEPPLVSVLDPELLNCFKKWKVLRKEKYMLKKAGHFVEQDTPIDSSLFAVPSTVHFNDFTPDKVYKKTVKIVNRSGQRIYCKPHKIKYEKENLNDPIVIQVEPWISFYAYPTRATRLKVTFSPLDTKYLEVDVSFFTRYTDDSWKGFSFHISCKPIEPKISLSTNLIRFRSKIWTNKIATKTLVIKNKGSVPCVMSVASTKVPSSTVPEGDLGGTKPEEFTYPFFISSKIVKTKLDNKDRIIKSRKEPKNHLQIVNKIDRDKGLIKKDKTITLYARSRTTIPIGYIGKTKLQNRVSFKDDWILGFCRENFRQEETLHLESYIEYISLLVEPHILNFQVVLVYESVHQDSFVITNVGKKSLKLNVKIPRELVKHVQVPMGSPIVPKGKSIPILVRLDIKSSFCTDAVKYIGKNNVLDFPLLISSDAESSPPIEVRIMAIVTNNMGLTITPQLLSLGKVYTHETVVVPFNLTNHTFATHYYGFLNLPKWVMVQPNYGFGIIAPGEILELELLFSPGVEQMGDPGNTVHRSFVIKCTTAERFANLSNVEIYREENTCLPKFKPHWVDPSNIITDFENYPVLPTTPTLSVDASYQDGSPESDNESKDNVIPPVCSASDRLFAIVGVKAVVCDTFCEFSAQRIVLVPTPYNSFSFCKLYLRCPNRGSGFLCYCGRSKGLNHPSRCNIKSRFELFSTHPFLSVEPCKGEILMNQDIKITLIMRPQPPFEEIEKVARTVKARAEEARLLEDWFVNRKKYKKKKSTKSASQEKRLSTASKSRKRSTNFGKRASTLKRQSKTQQTKRKSKQWTVRIKTPNRRLSRYGSSGKKDNYLKRKEKFHKSSSFGTEIIPTFSVDPLLVTLNNSDITSAMLTVLNKHKAKDFKCNVKCLIETQLSTNPPSTRYQELDLNVKGKIIHPDFVILSGLYPPQKFKFPATVIGGKNLLVIEIYNTSGRDILLHHSPFQPSDVFRCPTRLQIYKATRTKGGKVRKGIYMEPGEVIKFPVVFEPVMAGEVIQYIDFYTKTTFVPTKITGLGVIPVFSIIPEFTFAEMSPPVGAVAKCVITIRNHCHAELNFSFHTLAAKEGFAIEIKKPASFSSSRGKKSLVKARSPSKVSQRNSVSSGKYNVQRKSNKMQSIKRSEGSKAKLTGSKRRQSQSGSKNTTFKNVTPIEVKEALKSSDFSNLQEKHEHYFKFTPSVSVAPMGDGYIEVEFSPWPLLHRRRSRLGRRSVSTSRHSMRRQSRRKSRKSTFHRPSMSKGTFARIHSKEGEGHHLPEDDPNHYIAHTQLYLGSSKKIQDFYFLGIPNSWNRKWKLRGTLRRKFGSRYSSKIATRHPK